VPEQLFVNAQNPGEAISAVKALQKASAAGQRIYHITPANQSTILGNIHHDSDTMTEIRNALNAGKEAPKIQGFLRNANRRRVSRYLRRGRKA